MKTKKEMVKDILVKMLGDNAYNNTFAVDEDFKKLALAVDYLVIQILITKRWCDEDGQYHVDSVIDELLKIIK